MLKSPLSSPLSPWPSCLLSRKDFSFPRLHTSQHYFRSCFSPCQVSLLGGIVLYCPFIPGLPSSWVTPIASGFDREQVTEKTVAGLVSPHLHAFMPPLRFQCHGCEQILEILVRTSRPQPGLCTKLVMPLEHLGPEPNPFNASLL